MMHDIKMLQYIHKSAEMGKVGIESVLRESKDPNIRKALQAQHRRYQEIYGTAANYLHARGTPPQSANPIARINTLLTGTIKSTLDSTPSSIAHLMIRGNSAGLAKSIKNLRRYKGSDPLVMALANDLKYAEERSIEQMKKFL